MLKDTIPSIKGELIWISPEYEEVLKLCVSDKLAVNENVGYVGEFLKVSLALILYVLLPLFWGEAKDVLKYVDELPINWNEISFKLSNSGSVAWIVTNSTSFIAVVLNQLLVILVGVKVGLWFSVILTGNSKNCFVVGKLSWDAVILHVTMLPDVNVDPLILFFSLIWILEPVPSVWVPV